MQVLKKRKFMDCIVVDNLYVYQQNFFYIVNGEVYSDNNCIRLNHNIPNDTNIYPFIIDISGSKILALVMDSNFMLYQQTSNGLFTELVNRTSVDEQSFSYLGILNVPSSKSCEIADQLEKLPLTDIDPKIIINLKNWLKLNPFDYDQILNLLNHR